jgi:hypothetical protein
VRIAGRGPSVRSVHLGTPLVLARRRVRNVVLRSVVAQLKRRFRVGFDELCEALERAVAVKVYRCGETGASVAIEVTHGWLGTVRVAQPFVNIQGAHSMRL